ncbi:hypothetical protein FRC19_004339 [Serendipita sp. 401]|nr:hypothetical protein FRC19_004339 [Serendipita sp. 401]
MVTSVRLAHSARQALVTNTLDSHPNLSSNMMRISIRKTWVVYSVHARAISSVLFARQPQESRKLTSKWLPRPLDYTPLQRRLISSDKRPFKCPGCKRRFKTEEGLNSHKHSLAHHPRILPCIEERLHFRNYKYPSGVAHHLERPVETGLKDVARVVFKWDEQNVVTNPDVPGADSVTPPLGYLATEDTWSEDKKMYVCPMPLCKSTFSELDRLRRHLDSQVHRTDKKTYSCPSCRAHFSVISAALQHMEKGCGDITHKKVKGKYNEISEALRSICYNR